MIDEQTLKIWNQKKQLLKSIQIEAMEKKEFAPLAPRFDGSPAYHCNEATEYIMRKSGRSIDGILDIDPYTFSPSIGWTGATNIMIALKTGRRGRWWKDNLGRLNREITTTNNKGILEVPMAIGYDLSMMGVPVMIGALSIVGGQSHVATLWPDDARNKIANIGEKNGVFKYYEIFGKNLERPSFWIYPKIKKNKLLSSGRIINSI